MIEEEDDDQKIISLLKRGLAYEGFEVYTAIDGEAGLVAAQTYQPHLVLLDILIPGIDGFEMCRRLRLLDDIAIIMACEQHARVAWNDTRTTQDVNHRIQ